MCAEEFVADIQKKRQGLPACEAIFKLDKKADEIEQLFKQIANYKIEYNQPLIMETFR
jgi:hypothetical protein